MKNILSVVRLSALHDWLWQPDVVKPPLLLRSVKTIARFLYALGREILAGQLTLRAMSLVYTTLLSVIPLLALCFSLINLFGVHNSLKSQLYALMEPLGDRGVTITDWVVHTVDNLQGGVLGTVSLAFFIYTAIAMVQKVEESFNYVWLVPRTRNFARRLTEYISVILIGPVVTAIALSLIASIASDELVQRFIAREPLGGIIVASGSLLPWLLVTATFGFLYKFLPNAPVRIAAAMIGAIVAGTLWAAAGGLFASALSLAVGRNAVYGSFAIVISTLIWLYLNWLILLIGTQIAFYVQHPIFLRPGRREPVLDNSLRERLALNIMYLVGLAFRDSGQRCTATTISDATQVPGLTLSPIITALENAGLIGASTDDMLTPGRDMSGITLADILAAVREGGETGSLLPPLWSPPVETVATRLQGALDQLTTDVTLIDLLDESACRANDSLGSGDKTF
ncbi:MAG: YhjD/YihY/BrkB family envelope integrity protein [Gammaproteobacteria bacterium]